MESLRFKQGVVRSFNLYREAKDYYDKLIPDRVDGLVLLALFEKHGRNKFSEQEFIQVIEVTFKDLGLSSLRTEYQRNNNIILRLQDHFIWRDGSRKQYSFKPYGLEFCSRLEKRLQAGYNPAKIKRWFDDLCARLVELKSIEGGFDEWMVDHFEPRHITLAEQIETLDEQVNDSVKQFKEEVRSGGNQSNIIETLEKIQGGLDVIKLQANELKKAFQSTYDIDDILTEILESPGTAQHLDNIGRVRNFNDNVRSHLEQVSTRIDKIKPRIREFIYDFNQHNFDRKTEIFLNILLKYSIIYRESQGSKVLCLPTGIPLRIIQNPALVPKFIIIPIKEIAPKLPIESAQRVIDTSRQSKLLAARKIWKQERDCIQEWTSLAFDRINSSGRIDFTDFFFEVLEGESKNLSLAVKVTQRVLRRSSKSHDLEINIKRTFIVNDNFLNVAIWKMQIYKVQAPTTS